MGQIAKIANLLKLSIEETTAYCEEVRRASGFGTHLSYSTIARHLRGKKPTYPEPRVLASIIKQQESFRLTTGEKIFAAHKPSRKGPTVKELPPQEASTAPVSNFPSAEPGETLEKCPFCRKKMRSEYLAEHTRVFHASDLKLDLEKENLKTPLLDGVEIKSPDLIRKFQRRVIDEHGFLVSADMVPETKTESRRDKNFHRTGFAKPVEQPSVFDKIKSSESAIPGARIKKLRPEPNQQVLCPVCHKHTDYQNLFDHVAIRHPEQNAKFVLARFNREYEMWAKQNPNKHQSNKKRE